MHRVKITDTILRDAHQSLLATRMRTDDMLPVAEKLDEVGYFSLEMWGGATYDVCLRYLSEDPWERLKKLKKVIKNTNLQMLLRGQNLVGYRHYPDDVVVKFVQLAAKNGIDVFRVFDAVNDVRNMEVAIKTAKKMGAIVEGAICYTISPIHTVEKYLEIAKALSALECDIICIKDMAGILGPTDARTLTEAFVKEIKLPVHLHCHATSGMAPMSYLAGCEAGATLLDTALSPFAWGTSQPATETIVGALKNTPYDTGLDLALIAEISLHFQKVRAKYGALIDSTSEKVDTAILMHQIPGGMQSNLISQLKEQNALSKYHEVLKEVPLVRKELGYPPLVTPTSQIVGTQAVFNVLFGERYKLISKEVRDYIKGFYGRPPGEIDETVKKLAIGDEKPILCRPADLIQPELEKCYSETKGIATCDEDVISYALFPQVALQFFKSRGEMPPKAETPTPTKIYVEEKKPDVFEVKIGDKNYELHVSNLEAGKLMVELCGKRYEIERVMRRERITPPTVKPPAAEVKLKKVEKGIVTAPMPGRVTAIKVKEGQSVKKGAVVIIVEAMKMQNELVAPFDGFVKKILVKEGDDVDGGLPLVEIKS